MNRKQFEEGLACLIMAGIIITIFIVGGLLAGPW